MTTRYLLVAVRGLIIATLVGGIIGGLWLLDNPRYRYITYACQYNLIYGQTGRLDYAIIGGSRTLQSVGALELADAVREKTGREAVVYNLAHSWRGQGLNFVILRDLLERHEVKHLLVGANLAQPKKYHARFYLVGRTTDLIESLIGQKRWGPNFTVVGDITRMLIERLTKRASDWVRGKLQPRSPVTEHAPAATKRCIGRDEPVDIWVLETAKARFEKYYVGKVWKWNFDDERERHNTHFYRRIVELAGEHGISVTFFYVHRAYYKPLDPAFAEEFERRIGARLLIPPVSLAKELEADGYADQTHMTPSGRLRYTRWLYDQLSSEG